MHEFSPEIILRARAGDEIARRQVFQQLQKILTAYFVRQIGRKSEVEDLVQNTLLRVHRSLPDLQQPERFKAFAMKAALFELQDLFRGRYSIREQIYDPENMPERASMPENVGLQMDLAQAMQTLSPKARQIVELRQLGYPYDEIADLIGTTEAAVKMQVKRAFERLRAHLSPLMIFFLLLLWNW